MQIAVNEPLNSVNEGDLKDILKNFQARNNLKRIILDFSYIDRFRFTWSTCRDLGIAVVSLEDYLKEDQRDNTPRVVLDFNKKKSYCRIINLFHRSTRNIPILAYQAKNPFNPKFYYTSNLSPHAKAFNELPFLEYEDPLTEAEYLQRQGYSLVT